MVEVYVILGFSRCRDRSLMPVSRDRLSLCFGFSIEKNSIRQPIAIRGHCLSEWHADCIVLCQSNRGVFAKMESWGFGCSIFEAGLRFNGNNCVTMLCGSILLGLEYGNFVFWGTTWIR